MFVPDVSGTDVRNPAIMERVKQTNTTQHQPRNRGIAARCHGSLRTCRRREVRVEHVDKLVRKQTVERNEVLSNRLGS